MKSVYTSLLRGALPIIASCGISLMCGYPTYAQVEPGRYLFSGDQSIVLQPASRVADDTTDLSWSPDSSRLVAFNLHTRPIDAGETEATSEFTVVRWVRGNRTASTLYSVRITGKPDLIYPCEWLPATDTAIADMGWEEKLPLLNGATHKPTASHHILLWMDVRRGSVRQLEIGERDILMISPSKPLAVLLYVPDYGNADRPMVTTIRPDGTLGKSYEFAANQRTKRPTWSQDGRRLNYTLMTVGENKKVVSSIAACYDPVTGEIGPNPATTVQAALAPKPAMLQVSQPVRQLTEAETSAKVHPLWVSAIARSEHPRLLACADADMGLLSPDGTAIAYRSSGSAWVSELKSIPLVDFKQMLIQAQRADAMSKGKAIGLATLMWSMDNNEVLPGVGNISEISKYLGDPNDLAGFNLSYAGGPLGDVASPAETILGTMDGPGGVAVIYVDGHVKWHAN